MVKTLTVYKASAGSGKTFTLATQYIKLLVENPTNYRHILAVTFTNKATEEMKMRILSQLYGVWKGLPDSESYLQRIMADTGFDAQTVSRRAGEALHLLLHNYNYFRVETIDSFFQSVLRNLCPRTGFDGQPAHRVKRHTGGRTGRRPVDRLAHPYRCDAAVAAELHHGKD